MYYVSLNKSGRTYYYRGNFLGDWTSNYAERMLFDDVIDADRVARIYGGSVESNRS